MKMRCDEPMAEKKGLLRYCDHKCQNCIACIAMDSSYMEYHQPHEELKHSKFHDNKARKRNLDFLSGDRI